MYPFLEKLNDYEKGRLLRRVAPRNDNIMEQGSVTLGSRAMVISEGRVMAVSRSRLKDLSYIVIARSEATKQSSLFLRKGLEIGDMAPSDLRGERQV